MKKIFSYIGKDGLLHIVCSAVITFVLNLIMPLWIAVLITAIIGIGKEIVYDKMLGKGTFYKKDLICDAIGIVIGCI